MNTSTLYQLLQVDPRADADVIEAAYKRLVRKYHPDVNRSNDATAQMQALNAAYTVLRDPTQRTHYDTTLIAHTTPTPPPPVNHAAPPAHHAAPAASAAPARTATRATPASRPAAPAPTRDLRALRCWQVFHVAGGTCGSFIGLLSSISTYAYLGVQSWLLLFGVFIVGTYLIILLSRRAAQRLAMYPGSSWLALALTITTYVLYDRLFVLENWRARVLLCVVAAIGCIAGCIISLTPVHQRTAQLKTNVRDI